MTNFLNLPAQVFLPLPQFSFLLLAPATFPLPQNKKLLPISVTTTIAATNSTTSTVAITTITQLLLHFRLSFYCLLASPAQVRRYCCCHHIVCLLLTQLLLLLLSLSHSYAITALIRAASCHHLLQANAATASTVIAVSR